MLLTSALAAAVAVAILVLQGALETLVQKRGGLALHPNCDGYLQRELGATAGESASTAGEFEGCGTSRARRYPQLRLRDQRAVSCNCHRPGDDLASCRTCDLTDRERVPAPTRMM